MPRYPARIANRKRGGLWWRIPCVLTIWAILIAPLIAVWIGISVLRDYARDLPRVPDLERWEATLPRTNVIAAADGTVVAELPFSMGVEVGHRFVVGYEHVPRQMIQAVLAAEDVRFFSHRGVDPQSVVRAAWANYRAKKIVEGASTITQQVARNLLPTEIGNERSLRRKVREALLARRIERRYDKPRIFEVYVNHVFLGNNAYGIVAAARAYFDKTLEELSLAEAAMIAGLAQAPGRADPTKSKRAARERRDEVLERMHRAGFIGDQDLSRATSTDIELREPAAYYGEIAPWHTERARREVQEQHPDDYARGGLRVETSALPVLGSEALERSRSWSETLTDDGKGAPDIAALLWDHTSGYVEATVGGHRWDDSQFDRATQACRQPGSAFKPLVYAAAIEADKITPGTALRDAPIAEYDARLDVHWKPTNSGRSFKGVALAQDAIAASLNAPAVDVLDRIGGERVIDLARRLGISTEVDDVRPMALGASCVVPFELAHAFSVFARGGRGLDPVFVVRITRGDQVLVDRAAHTDPTLHPARRLDRLVAFAAARLEAEPILDPQSSFLISNMLRDVVRRGTGVLARNIGRPAAGKTGTTNNNTDAWFVGYTGRVTAAVWVGYDNPARTLGRSHDGSRAALPLWKNLVVMAEAEREPVEVPGEPPDGLVRARIDRETGYLARPGAGGAIDLYFRRGTEPTQVAGHVQGVPTTMKRVTREF